MTSFEERIENMAAAVHDQWMRWAQTVMDAEDNISPGRRERWEQYMVPYEELDEPIKEYDRIEARILIEKFLDGDPLYEKRKCVHGEVGRHPVEDAGEWVECASGYGYLRLEVPE